MSDHRPDDDQNHSLRLDLGSFCASALRALASPRLTFWLCALWLANVWGSILYLAPGADDGGFLGQALGFIHRGDIGLMYMDRFQVMFLNLPAYHFLQAVFFKLWLAAGLPLDVYTHRIYVMVVVTLLLVCALRLIGRVDRLEDRSTALRQNLFLVTLGISPFVFDYLFLRPETTGLLFLLLATSCVAIALDGHRVRGVPVALAGLCAGIAALTHPTITVVAGAHALCSAYVLGRRRAWPALSTAVAAALVPVSVMLAWMMHHAPESWAVLAAHVGHRAPSVGSLGRGFAVMVDYALLGYEGRGPSLINLYYAIPFAVLTGIVVATVAFMLRSRLLEIGNDLFRSVPRALIGSMFVGALISVAISSSPKIQLYTVLGFVSVLALVTVFPLSRGGRPEAG